MTWRIHRRRRPGIAPCTAVLLVAAIVLSGPAPAAAEGEAANAVPPGRAVPLEKLLKLPDATGYDMERRGGATRSEWRARYERAYEERDEARKSYEEAMAKLEKVASDSDTWRLVPPGGDVAAENQDNIRLRRDLEKRRSELERAEKRVRDLDIEADLASVPPEWRRDREAVVRE